MIAILYAIWAFLVALGPFLTAIGAILVSLTTAIWEIVKITALITLIAAAIEILFDKRGKTRIANLLYNLTAGGLSIVETTLSELTPELQAIIRAFAGAFGTAGPDMKGELTGPIGNLAAENFTQASDNLAAGGESTQDNAIAQAGAAFKQAFGFGMSSAAVTAAFEACFPEKLNVLNGVGPAFAQMAGFEEIAAEVLGPLYRHSFGTSLDYHYRSLFKPDLPGDGEATEWFARGLMTTAQLQAVADANGLKPGYFDVKAQAAFRPVPPFLLGRAAAIGAIAPKSLDDALVFAGFRGEDIDMLEKAYAALALRPYQVAYLTAAERSVELGTDTPASLSRSMDDMGLNPEIQNWVQLTVAERKLQQLAELYRKSVSESYKYGTISDDQYIPALEAIGIASEDAQAHYAIDSITKQGKILQAALRAEEKLARQQKSAAMRAAVAEYHAGLYDDAALEGALLAAGIDPTITTFAVVINSAKRQGPLVLVYGVELGRRNALVLREQVSALARQATARLITPADARAQLTVWNIPTANQDALLALWYATTTPPARVGIKLPP